MENQCLKWRTDLEMENQVSKWRTGSSFWAIWRSGAPHPSSVLHMENFGPKVLHQNFFCTPDFLPSWRCAEKHDFFFWGLKSQQCCVWSCCCCLCCVLIVVGTDIVDQRMNAPHGIVAGWGWRGEMRQSGCFCEKTHLSFLIWCLSAAAWRSSDLCSDVLRLNPHGRRVGHGVNDLCFDVMVMWSHSSSSHSFHICTMECPASAMIDAGFVSLVLEGGSREPEGEVGKERCSKEWCFLMSTIHCGKRWSYCLLQVIWVVVVVGLCW